MVRILKVFVPVRVILLLLSEAVILYASYLVALLLVGRFLEGEASLYSSEFLFEERGFLRIGIGVAVIMFGLYLNDLYEEFRIPSRIALFQQVSLALGIAFVAQAMMSYAVSGWIVPRYTMILGSIFILLLTPLWRMFYTSVIFDALGTERILLVGTSDVLGAIVKQIAAKPALGLTVIGYLDDGAGGENPFPGIPKLGEVQDLKEVTQDKPDRIVVGLRERRTNLSMQDLLDLRFSGVHIEEASALYEIALGRVCTSEFRPSQLVFSKDFSPPHSSVSTQTIYCTLFAGTLLVVLAPVMLVVALAVRFTSPGPIFYRQTRVGRGNKPFTLFKFRSMYVDAEARTGAVWATRNDPRITPLGRILRKTRLDELPQLFNVLKGQMAIAGPRPERPEFVTTLSREIPYYRQRHTVKPGITGWAQINYKYGDTFEDTVMKLEYDLYYIKNISMALDMYIFFHTIKTMLLSRGAQ
jgi:sugar transferase (PEP-CTERM system associated)